MDQDEKWSRRRENEEKKKKFKKINGKLAEKTPVELTVSSVTGIMTPPNNW